MAVKFGIQPFLQRLYVDPSKLNAVDFSRVFLCLKIDTD